MSRPSPAPSRTCPSARTAHQWSAAKSPGWCTRWATASTAPIRAPRRSARRTPRSPHSRRSRPPPGLPAPTGPIAFRARGNTHKKTRLGAPAGLFCGGCLSDVIPIGLDVVSVALADIILGDAEVRQAVAVLAVLAGGILRQPAAHAVLGGLGVVHVEALVDGAHRLHRVGHQILVAHVVERGLGMLGAEIHAAHDAVVPEVRSEEHTSELQ